MVFFWLRYECQEHKQSPLITSEDCAILIHLLRLEWLFFDDNEVNIFYGLVGVEAHHVNLSALDLVGLP